VVGRSDLFSGISTRALREVNHACLILDTLAELDCKVRIGSDQRSLRGRARVCRHQWVPAGVSTGAEVAEQRVPSKSSGLLYGLGLGGFIDGIVLHQILQWHHMVSHVGQYPVTTVAGLEVNTAADGFFHLVTWVLVLAGSITALKAWRDGRFAPSWSFHFGLILVGWGIFNVVEGVIDHQVLGVHHVRDDLGAPLSWDLGFLALGVLLIVGGWALHKHGLTAMQRRTQHVDSSA